MTKKLDWEYDTTHGCQVAFHNGYMIKAEHDDSPSNPFEDHDGNWPIAVYAGRHGKWMYPKGNGLLSDPIGAFNDGQLVHDQIAIATALGTTIAQLCIDHLSWDPRKYIRDADMLREAFEAEWQSFEGSKQLEVAAELWNLAGVPALCGQTTGYCQGDWAQVLVVATPEKVKEFGCTDIKPEDLRSTIDLYGHWAWGDVYGYTIWAPVYDEDGEVEDWEQLDGSCWGYYGADHDESGLEEAALSEVPDEPVRVPDAQPVTEDA